MNLTVGTAAVRRALFATLGILWVALGIIGTGAILFFVRTTAARQSLILSSPRTGAGRVPPRSVIRTAASVL